MKTKLDLIRDSKYLAKEAYLFIVSNDNMFNLIADKVLQFFVKRDHFIWEKRTSQVISGYVIRVDEVLYLQQGCNVDNEDRSRVTHDFGLDFTGR